MLLALLPASVHSGRGSGEGLSPSPQWDLSQDECPQKQESVAFLSGDEGLGPAGGGACPLASPFPRWPA